MSNFSYWEDKPEFESFIIPAKKAEAFLVTAPETCMSECRKVAEQMVRLYLKNEKIPLTYKKGGKIYEVGKILSRFGNYLKNINGINIKAELEDINNKTKVFHHSKNYACIEDGVAVLKKLFFCLTVLFPIKSISADNFSEAEIQNFPKHLLRSINIQKFLSLEMLKYIALGDITHTEEYIAQHHNDLFSEINGEFPLLVAIQQDEIGIVKLFDKYFKDQYALFAYNLGKRGLDPMHPIFYAAKYNSRKCFDYYFENLIPSEGINMTTQNSKRSLLMYACIGNAEEILSKLLIIPEIEIDKKDLYDSTALLYLLQTNPNSPFIKILVERGADLNVESQDRFPLMYATENNLQLFLDNGAELNKKNGVSCLYYAINFAPGSVNHIIKILKKAAPEISWNSNAFAYACKWGKDIDFIEILWNKIIDQIPNDDGEPLVFKRKIEVYIRFAFKLSLQKDNNIKVLDYLYSLAIKYSINLISQNNSLTNIQVGDYIYYPNNVLWLINHGFFDLDLYSKDKLGKSALDYAEEQGLKENLLAAVNKRNQVEIVETEDSKITLLTGILQNLRPDKEDNTKIYDGRIVYNGEVYNFKKTLFNSNHQIIEYNSSYCGRTVSFHITKEAENDKPGWADQVTLIE